PLTSTHCAPPATPLFPYTTLFRSRVDHRIHVFESLEVALNAHGFAAERCGHLHGFGRIRVAAAKAEHDAMAALDRLQHERAANRSEEHTSELQSRFDLVCRLLLEK